MNPALSPQQETDDPALQADVQAMQQITFRLSWASRRRLAQELEHFHLTVPQFTALRALQRRCDEQELPGCSMSELAEASHQVSATMTGIVDRLTERGLVERQRSASDRRSLRVVLTGQGLALLDQIDQLQRQRMQASLSSLSAQERQQILRLMERYLEATLAGQPLEPK